MVDECTDSATMEQLGVYVRYIDIKKYKLSEQFLEIVQSDVMNLTNSKKSLTQTVPM